MMHHVHTTSMESIQIGSVYIGLNATSALDAVHAQEPKHCIPVAAGKHSPRLLIASFLCTRCLITSVEGVDAFGC